MSRPTPFDEVERLLERLDDARGSSLAVDVVDADDAFEVTADLPGFEKADVEVEVQDRTVRIDADRDTEHEREDEDYVRRERTTESASRSVTLPEAIEEDAASATLANGVLTVRLPKAHASDDATSVDIE